MITPSIYKSITTTQSLDREFVQLNEAKKQKAFSILVKLTDLIKEKHT
jgi:hypothetical protein